MKMFFTANLFTLALVTVANAQAVKIQAPGYPRSWSITDHVCLSQNLHCKTLPFPYSPSLADAGFHVALTYNTQHIHPWSLTLPALLGGSE